MAAPTLAIATVEAPASGKPARAKRASLAAAPADDAEIAKLRQKLQLIVEEYTELGRRPWQLDDKTPILKWIKERGKAAKRAR